MTTEPARRRDPPAQLAKIATAGATGMFVFGLTAVMGWADRPTGEPGGLPAVPVSTVSPTTIPSTAPATVAPTTTLVPLATTIAPAPSPARSRLRHRRLRSVVTAAARPTTAAPGAGRRRVGAVPVTIVSRAIRNFRAMGCRSTIVIEGAGCDRLAELAMIRIARLEACWSLFLPDSDVSRINRADGASVGVRPATLTLLRAMAEATAVTGGAYDPTVRGPESAGSVGRGRSRRRRGGRRAGGARDHPRSGRHRQGPRSRFGGRRGDGRRGHGSRRPHRRRRSCGVGRSASVAG